MIKLPHYYNIGDYVKVNEYAEFTYSVINKDKTAGFAHNRYETKRIIEKIKQPFIGQIVGGTYKKTGTVGKGGYDFEGGSPDPNYLYDEKSHFVWLVRKGMINKEICVLPEDLELAKDLDPKITMKWKV